MLATARASWSTLATMGPLLGSRTGSAGSSVFHALSAAKGRPLSASSGAVAERAATTADGAPDGDPAGDAAGDGSAAPGDGAAGGASCRGCGTGSGTSGPPRAARPQRSTPPSTTQ